ncbi:hypothetical protein [Dokdonia sp.]|uniref:hypothetical protein n=1 Tax=Dokdonia sp. TaxID=2024995 RepID=UPI003266898F
MKVFTLLFLFLVSFSGIAQEPFLSFEHYLKTSKKVTQLFSAVFPENNTFLVFVEDKKQLAVYSFDQSGREISEGFTLPKFAKEYPNIGGYTYQNDAYTLYLSTENKEDWALITLDFKKKSFDLQEVSPEINQNRILESLTYNGKHYLFTVKRDTSIVELFVLDSKGSITTQLFSFEDAHFEVGKSTKNLYGLLNGVYAKDVTTLDNNSPNALETSKPKNKFYQEDHLIAFTIDVTKNNTYYLQFDLENNTTDYQAISKKTFEKKILRTESNSFMFDNKLFVLKASSEEMDFSIHNLNATEKSTSFSAQQGTPIDFKNTPIIQEGGGFKSYRELEKTSKFLRKVSLSDAAISVFKENDNYIITLGGTKEVAKGGPPVYIYGAGLTGAVIGGIMSGIANATYYQYNAYTYTKSARFQMVLDESLNFVPDIEVPLNSFDNIKEFTQDTPETVIQTVFKFSDTFIWGALNAKNNKINFFKF